MRPIYPISIALFLIMCMTGNAQFKYQEMSLKDYKNKKTTQFATNSSVPVEKNKSVNVGLCFGYNQLFEDVYDVFISPDTNVLRIEKLQKGAFVASTVLLIPIWSQPDKSMVLTTSDSNNNLLKANKYLNGLTAVIAVNLLQLNNAQGSEALNYKLDGGIGLGWRFQSNFMISLTYDLTSVLQPRDYLLEYKDKPLIVDGVPLKELNKENSNYFIARYMSSFSIRFAYAFVNKEF